MRDIDLYDDADPAYVEAAPGSLPADTTEVDPSFADTKAYTKPSLGGELGPARAPILSAPADGGEALLDAAAVVTVTPPVVPTPPIVWPGRAANNTSFNNLYPWHKTPPEGLDMNNPNPPPAPAPPPPPPAPTGVTHTSVLVGNNGNATFSGPATRNAIVTVEFSLDGGPVQQLMAMIASGDTGSQIAAKVRAVVDAFVGLDASGTGGSVNVIGIGGNLTAFNITVS